MRPPENVKGPGFHLGEPRPLRLKDRLFYSVSLPLCLSPSAVGNSVQIIRLR